MAAARANLGEVLTPHGYTHLDRLAAALRAEIEQTIADAELPWHVVSIGAKGCITFRAEPVREYRDFLEVDARFGEAHWLVQHNGGVFLPPWGKVEQWLCLLYTSPSPRDGLLSRMPSS